MKNFIKISFAFVLGLLLFSCSKDEDMAVLSPTTPASLASSKTALVLVKDDAAKPAISFNWTNPSSGPALAYNNQLQFNIKGNPGTKVTVDLPKGENSITYTVQEFNSVMLKLGLPLDGTTSNVEAKVKSSIYSLDGSATTLPDAVYSSTLNLTVKPYALISYLYAPGAYQGWNPPTANTLTSATSNGIYVGIINFIDPNSEFKITPARTWDNSYGTNGGNTLVYNGGGNIPAPNAGSQKLTVNLNDLTYSLAPYSWGIIGSATPTGWDSDTNMIFNDATQTWQITINLIPGEIKFRLNDKWDTNYGDTGNNGSLEPGGDNIPISEAGTYKITFDEVNFVWTKTKI